MNQSKEWWSLLNLSTSHSLLKKKKLEEFVKFSPRKRAMRPRDTVRHNWSNSWAISVSPTLGKSWSQQASCRRHSRAFATRQRGPFTVSLAQRCASTPPVLTVMRDARRRDLLEESKVVPIWCIATAAFLYLNNVVYDTLLVVAFDRLTYHKSHRWLSVYISVVYIINGFTSFPVL